MEDPTPVSRLSSHWPSRTAALQRGALNLSPEFQAAVIVDNQVGRLQIMIADVATPLAALPEQVLAQVTWQIKGGAVEAANLRFSDTPATSFGDVVGRAIPGAVTEKPF